MHIVDKTFSKQKYSVSFYIEDEHNKIRLDKFLGEYFTSFSRQFIKSRITRGDVVIHDRPHPHKPSTKIYTGETITVHTYKSDFEEEKWRGSPIKIDEVPGIVFEDSDIVVMSKPAFMATHPTGKHLFNCASLYFEVKYGHTMHSVHRLDRETSGILIMAKNPTAAREITFQFEKTEVKKCYLLISRQEKDMKDKFPFTANERLDSGENHVNSVVICAHPEDSDKGKTARTDYRFLEQENGVLLALAFPQSGRQHQIRVHAAEHGFPLVGDKLYNGDYQVFERFKDGVATEADHDLMELPRHALHAIAIMFKYQGEQRIFQAPLPTDLMEWLTNNGVKTKFIEEKIQVEVENYFEK